MVWVDDAQLAPFSNITLASQTDDRPIHPHRNMKTVSIENYCVNLYNIYEKVAQLSQRDRAAGWASYGQN